MGSHDWESLLASGDIEKLKNDELKAYLKVQHAAPSKCTAASRRSSLVMSILSCFGVLAFKQTLCFAHAQEAKQPQNGEKGTLIARIRMHVESRKLDVDLGDGQKDPFLLGLPALRKASALVAIDRG